MGECSPFDLHDLDNLARAADIYNTSMQLKVDQEPRGFLAQRAIGSGFHSILFADCRCAADVSACASCARRPRRAEEPTEWSPRCCSQSCVIGSARCHVREALKSEKLALRFSSGSLVRE